jgi:hypothetical protein
MQETQLPAITADEYRTYLTYLLGGKSSDESWIATLHERQRHASGLKMIIPATFGKHVGYILVYETRYIVKLVGEHVLTLLSMTPNINLQKDGIIHYLLQKTFWFNELDAGTHNVYKTIADTISSGTLIDNPHITYFTVRWGVILFQKFDIVPLLPARFLDENRQFKYCRNAYIVLYGTGKETPGYNIQFEIYLRTLVNLLRPNITDEQIIDVLCNQLTNEITEINGALQLDLHLVERVQGIFQTNPQLVDATFDRHLYKLLAMPNKIAGMELAGGTAAMMKQIVPCIITALSPEEQQVFSGFVTTDYDR